MNEKSILYSHPEQEQRSAFLEDFLKKIKNEKYYLLPESIKSSGKYFQSIQNLFPLKKMNSDQLKDLQLDWVPSKTKTAIIIPEFHKLLKNEKLFFYDIISAYFTRCFQLKGAFRFLVTLDKLPVDFLDHITLYVGRDSSDKRTTTEIATELIEFVSPSS
jgi:hypothetical protein